MSFYQKAIIITVFFFCSLWLLGFSFFLGTSLAEMRNIQQDTFEAYEPAIPTTVLDIHGELITEFYAEENRRLAKLSEMPLVLLYALLTREDLDFFEHEGISPAALMRAGVNILLGRYFSGGSTLTQQLAKILYTDRAWRSLRRKFYEMWWALQMEKTLSKQEIIERYLNKMYFGHGNYGVATASDFFFQKDVSEITPAEASMLIIQLASPALYSPINNITRAQRVQKEILDQMVWLGYLDDTKALDSYQTYWDNYDWNRSSAGAAFRRRDQAPYFSEYIRKELSNLLLGSRDIYRDGYIVHTSLNLAAQKEAEKFLGNAIDRANRVVSGNRQDESSIIDTDIVPYIDLLSDFLGNYSTRVNGRQWRTLENRRYFENAIDEINLFADLLGLEEIADLAEAYGRQNSRPRTLGVEGALVAIDNDTGYIVTLIGGREFTPNNQFNRATAGNMQAGSAFKPFLYAAAIEARTITAASAVVDAPIALLIPDTGELYTPNNFQGRWQGIVSARQALIQSLNIPSIRILENLGFNKAILYISRFLGLSNDTEIRRVLPAVYPLALGISSISPLRMAQGFSVFANAGTRPPAIAIRYVEDRNGRIVVNPEEEIKRQRELDGYTEVISPQTSYVMTNILQEAYTRGTLAGASYIITRKDIDFAGKTGTTQNWTDAWAVGYSPYITTAIWFGFDRKGNSLGINQTGASLAAPVWGHYMNYYHRDLPPRQFIQPPGIVFSQVQSITGLLPEGHPDEVLTTEIFIEGTQPQQKSNYYQERDAFINRRLYQPQTAQDNLSSFYSSFDQINDDFSLDIPQDIFDNLLEETQIEEVYPPENNPLEEKDTSQDLNSDLDVVLD